MANRFNPLTGEYAYGFRERMQDAADRAAYRRHRGLHTGGSAKGWDWKPAPLDPGSFDAAYEVARASWRSDKLEAINDYRVACLHGPGREDDNAIPF